MKKKKYILIIFCFVLLITGCGKKVLDCKRNIIKNDSLVVDQEMVFEYKNKKVVREKLIVSYKTNSNTNIDALKSSLEDQYSNYYGVNGIKYYFEDTDEGFDFVIDVNMKKVKKSVINELDLYDKDKTTTYYKLKDQGYTCE